MNEAGHLRGAGWLLATVILWAFLIALIARHFSVELKSVLSIVGFSLTLAIVGRVLRKCEFQRAGNYMTATAQMMFITTCLTALAYVLASLDFPLQDNTLHAIDGMFGLHWRSLLDLFLGHPELMAVMNYAYTSIDYQVLLILPALALFGNEQSSQRFVLYWSLALAATILVSPLVPALGGFLHLGIKPEDVPSVHVLAAWRFVEPFNALRDGSMRALQINALAGIVTFPSFHAAAAVLFARGGWDIPFLRWPILVLTTLMLLSAVPIGGRYVVDVVVGSCIAVCAIAAVSFYEKALQLKRRSAVARAQEVELVEI